jgi:hypothetical protein
LGMYLQEAKVDEKWQAQWSGLNNNTKMDITNWVAHAGMDRNYWASLDLPFQAFIVELAQNQEKAMTGWYAQLRRSALAAFDLAADSAGEDARALKATVHAESYLRYRLNEVLPSNERQDP